MGRLSKIVVLALLLMFAGVQEITPRLCAEPLASHVHRCCAAHQQASAMHCGTAPALSGIPSCCKVSPIESMPALPILNSGGAHDRAYVLSASSEIAGVLRAPILL